MASETFESAISIEVSQVAHLLHKANRVALPKRVHDWIESAIAHCESIQQTLEEGDPS